MTKESDLARVRAGQCPDCGEATLDPGPRGGLSVNVACRNCGGHFNLAGGADESPTVIRFERVFLVERI